MANAKQNPLATPAPGTPAALATMPGPVATPAPVATTPATLPTLPTTAPGTALVAGQRALASGVVVVVPVTGHYVTAAPGAGWPCHPGTTGYVLHGSNATVATTGPLGPAGGPATALVTGQQASGGRARAGAVPGHYKVWPFAGSKVWVVVPG